jgi:hypothetical protein
MTMSVSNETLTKLFGASTRLPCREGTSLLRKFAEARPTDFAFLQPSDFADLQNSGFIGIREWAAFADHYGQCESCND